MCEATSNSATQKGAQLESLIMDLKDENNQLKQNVSYLKDRVEKLENLVHLYQEQDALKNLKLYGSSSERTVGEQISFFNDAEHLSTPEATAEEFEEISYKRKKSTGKTNRTLDLESFPKERIEYPLPAEEVTCGCGQERHVIDEETRDELVYQPAKYFVRQHVTFVYGCRRCDHEGDGTPIVRSMAPKAVIPKSFVSAQ
jgi:hypothetical protein